MQRLLIGIYHFYKKLAVPSLAFAAIVTALGNNYVGFTTGLGIAILFVGPVFHYFTYEVNHPDEYYFYYNLGFSRAGLWISTLVINSIAGILLIRL